MKAITVLVHEWVTGGGLAGSGLPRGWADEGRAMRRAVADDFLRLEGVEVVTTLDPRYVGEGGPRAEVVGPGREEEVLRRLAASSDFTALIAPETGGVLESRARLVEEAGGRSLGPTPDAVALAADKRRLAAHWAGAGVRTPRTEPWSPRVSRPEGVSYPAVVKPVDGAGSQHTYRVESPADRPFREPLPEAMVVQPYVPGAPMSATFLVSPTGKVRLVGVGWQETEVRGGVVHYLGGRLPAPEAYALGEPLRAVRALTGLRGLVGVDFVREAASGVSTVLELNPRPTTSYVGLVRLLPPGALAWAWLAACRGDLRADDLRGMIPAGRWGRVRFSADGTCEGGNDVVPG